MKFYGKIGYGPMKETRPGVWEEQIEERDYYGDITRNSSRFQSSGQVNDDFVINNEFSIVADPYAFENFAFMRYITYGGVKWAISGVEIQYPRMILTIGGV